VRRPNDENPIDDNISDEEFIDPLLDPLQLEPTAVTVAPPSDDADDQPTALALSGTEMTPLFLNLPPEVISMILRFLSSDTLRNIASFNRMGRWLALRVRIERFWAIQANSLLWHYLLTMAQDQPEAAGARFIEYCMCKCCNCS
jgi:hypothetical protein